MTELKNFTSEGKEEVIKFSHQNNVNFYKILNFITKTNFKLPKIIL